MPTLYILYNASSTLLGKLSYGYKKISCPKDADPICAACEITHGGLSLKETPAWSAAKTVIESEGIKVVQWHRDEMDEHLKTWMKDSNIELPVAVLSEKPSEYRVVVDKKALGSLGGDAQAFVEELRRQGVLQGNGNTAQASL